MRELLTSTTGLTGGLSTRFTFTFFIFLPGLPSSPSISSLRKKERHADQTIHPFSIILQSLMQVPVVPVLLFISLGVWYVHVLRLPARLIVRQIPPFDEVVNVILLIHAEREN